MTVHTLFLDKCFQNICSQPFPLPYVKQLDSHKAYNLALDWADTTDRHSHFFLLFLRNFFEFNIAKQRK